ncbi:carbohydrate ABC transporter permease [Micromonospora inyonensis]|uniref:carbohydrate ABC transporter permease n=1 Tax=Micromonospora inyonensis TaxID=47866 RepID=UPI000AFC2F7B|nr:sugar ABC transporter permease [Micromonospora inyonensis]
MAIDAPVAPATPPAPPRGGRRRGGVRGDETLAGWLFVAPVVAILGLFLLLPILMAFWVSLTGWNGQGSPFTSEVPFVGADNYTRLFTEEGLARRDFMTSIRNNLYYVAIVVPTQTALALGLALVVNNRMLRGKSFFRSAFYLPSVTRSVAISVVFLFLFATPERSTRCSARSASTGRSGSPTPAACSTSCSARSGSTSRRPRSPTAARSA